jgi:ribosomal protein S1
MTFTELEKEDIAFKQFEYLKSFLAVHNQRPVKVIRIDNAKTCKILVIKQAQTGVKAITTKQFNLPIEDAPFFTAWLGQEFPQTEMEYIKR